MLTQLNVQAINVVTIFFIVDLINVQGNQSCGNCLNNCNTCSDNITCSQCSSQFYLDTTSKICLSCDKSCFNCSDAKNTSCLSCSLNQSLINSVCIGSLVQQLTTITTQNITDSISLAFQFVTLSQPLNQTFLLMTISAKISFIQQTINPSLVQNNQSLNNSKSNTSLSSNINGTFLWFSIGLGMNPHNCDLIVMQSDGTNIQAFDGQIYPNQLQLLRDDQLGKHNDVYVQNYNNDNTSISIQFVRPLNTSENQDTIIQYNQQISWAVGLGITGLSKNQGQTFYHGKSRGFSQLSVNNQSLINKCDSNCDSKSCQVINGTCTKCSDGYYLHNNQCQICHSTCLTCYDSGEDDCLSCSTYRQSMSLFLIQGQCLNEQIVDEQLNQDNQNNVLTFQSFQEYVFQFGIIYGIRSSPFDICVGIQCIYGFCLNGVCQCISDAIGYFCEISNKTTITIQPKLSNIINRITSESTIQNSPELLSGLNKQVSKALYALNPTLVQQNIVLMNSLINQINVNNYTQQRNTNANLIETLLNMMEYQDLQQNSTDTSIRNQLTQLMDSQMAQVIKNNSIVYVSTNYGFVYLAPLVNISDNPALEQNLQILRKTNPNNYVSYLQLYNDSTIKVSLQNQFNLSSIQLDIKIYDNMKKNMTFPSNVTLKLQQIQTTYLNQSNLQCIGYNGVNSIQILTQPQQINPFYACIVSSGRFMVGQKIVVQAAQIIKQGIWSENNVGFLTCVVIEFVTIFLMLSLYGYDKYNEKLVKTYHENDQEKSNKLDEVVQNEQPKFFLVQSGNIISPLQTGKHSHLQSHIPLFQQDEINQEDFNIQLSQDLSKIEAREQEGSLESNNEPLEGQFEEQQLDSKRDKILAMTNQVGRGQRNSYSNNGDQRDMLNQQGKFGQEQDEYVLKTTGLGLSQTQSAIKKELKVASDSMKESQGSNAPLIKVNSVDVDENGFTQKKGSNSLHLKKILEAPTKPELKIGMADKELTKTPNQNQKKFILRDGSQNPSPGIVSPGGSQPLSPGRDLYEHVKEHSLKDSQSGSEATHEEHLTAAVYDIWNLHPIVSILRSVTYHRKLVWQLHFFSLFMFTIHVYLLILIFCFDIYVAINGNTQDVNIFIVFTLVAIIISWPFNYLFGFVACLFRREEEEQIDEHEHDSNQNLSQFYWIVWGFSCFAIDFIISWRAYYYQLGVPDYWLAASFFCPIIDFLAFDTFFILIVHAYLHKGQDKDKVEMLLNLLKVKGHLQKDLYLRSLKNIQD